MHSSDVFTPHGNSKEWNTNPTKADRVTATTLFLKPEAKLTSVVFVGALLIFAACLLGRPFFTRGEAREALVIQAMVQQDNFILPMTNEGKIPHKPPMFHWLGVVSSKILGHVSEFTIRLPSALTSAATLAFFFLFVARVSNIQRATLSTLILSTTFEWFRSSTHARVDMCFASGIIITLSSLYLAISTWQKTNKSSPLWLTLAAIATAFAVLSKGPGGLIIICAVVGLYLFTIFEDPLIQSVPKFPWKPFLAALAGSILIAGSWYYLAYVSQGSDFLGVQIFKENYARFVSVKGSHPGHGKPFYYIFIHLILGFLPWSLLFPPLLVWSWKNRERLLIQENGGLLFALIWICVLIAVVWFSIAKRMVYLLPAYPPLALLLSVAIEEIWKERRNYKSSLNFSKWAALFLGGVMLWAFLLLFLLSVVGEPLFSNVIPIDLMSDKQAILVKAIVNGKYTAVSSAALGLLLLSVAMLTYHESKPRYSLKLLAGFSISLFATISLVILPAVAAHITPKDLMREAASIVPQDAPLFEYKHTFYPAIYYAGRPIATIKKLTDLPSKDKDTYLIFRIDDKANIVSSFPDVKIISESKTLGANGDEKLCFALIPKQHSHS